MFSGFYRRIASYFKEELSKRFKACAPWIEKKSDETLKDYLGISPELHTRAAIVINGYLGKIGIFLIAAGGLYFIRGVGKGDSLGTHFSNAVTVSAFGIALVVLITGRLETLRTQLEGLKSKA